MAKKKRQKKDLVAGQRIVKVREMTPLEADDEGWDERLARHNMVIVLENGVLLYASQDREGNGPGALFAREGDRLFEVAP